MTIVPNDVARLEDRQKSRLRRAWRFLTERGLLEIWRLARQHGLQ